MITKEITNWDLQYDVIIAGGGTTGCCAAIAAARHGAKTLLVEKMPFCGGNMSSGLPWLAFHAQQSGELVVDGIPMEIIRRLQSTGGATNFVFDPITGSGVGVNGTMLKMILVRMLREASVDILLHTIISGVKTLNGRYKAIIITNKQGSQMIQSKTLVDCTDSADAAVMAGGRFILGRESDSKRQVSSNIMFFGDIDFSEMLQYFEAHPDQIRPFKLSDEVLTRLLKQMYTAPIFVLGAFSDIISAAKENGLNYQRDKLIGVAYTDNHELMLVASRVNDVDVNDIRNHSNAELDGMDQTWGILELLHQYIPGCKRARLVSCGAQLGIRETRHIEGDYLLTAQNLMEGGGFVDTICRGGYHMDIHSPDYAGLNTLQPPIYGVPYRSLLVKGVDGILVAGRGISATHEAMSSTRVAPISAAMGQAAGTAAALSIQQNLSLREIAVSELRDMLKKDCAIV